jgi:hypothetical protein
MYAEQDTRSDPAQLTPLYFVALLESQVIARQALRRLESLYRQYPDQALRDAIDALRDAHGGEQ